MQCLECGSRNYTARLVRLGTLQNSCCGHVMRFCPECACTDLKLEEKHNNTFQVVCTSCGHRRAA
jgi:hypothetical protein